jgi:branched-chain amino acid transport system permease protein
VPALRLRGGFLAVTTLAFAVATQLVLFGSSFFTRLIPGRVRRPSMLFVSFASERNYYFLCLAILGVSAMMISQIRRSRPGRVLIAIRDNDAAVESFGIAVVRSQLAAFALSGGLCGIAGVLFAHHQRAVDPLSFQSSVSIEVFVMAMIGGITSVPGALLGAAYVGVANFLIPNAVFRNLATSGGLLVLLFVAPGGLSSLAAQARDAMLRIVATRRGIVVPSLFADTDLEALREQRAPMVEPIPFRGLEAIPASRRYRQHSPRHDPASAR